MTKQEEFLWIVQTTILANGINLAASPDTRKTYQHIFSATGVLATADEATRASTLIPDSMTAFGAAHEFCNYVLENLRTAEQKATGKDCEVPGWFARS